MMTSREMLEQLVAFDTTSRESNLALIDFIGGYLTGLGVDYERIHNAERSKANLYARLGPPGPAALCYRVTAMWCPLTGRTGAFPLHPD
jgi:acetylornithine deacetylase